MSKHRASCQHAYFSESTKERVKSIMPYVVEVSASMSCLGKSLTKKTATPRSQPGPLGVLHGQSSRFFILLQENMLAEARGRHVSCNLLAMWKQVDDVLGPCTHESLLRTAESGRLCALTLVCTDGFRMDQYCLDSQRDVHDMRRGRASLKVASKLAISVRLWFCHEGWKNW